MNKENFINKFIQYFKNGPTKTYTPTLRIVDILQDENDDYFVEIQCIGKMGASKKRPEEILADDALTKQFSPIDVRTLTYLGYLGINAPQYKLLAQRLSENEKMTFAVYKKRENKLENKTANDILNDKSIMESLDQDDVAKVSYSAALNHIQERQENQRKIKQKYIKQQKNN